MKLQQIKAKVRGGKDLTTLNSWQYETTVRMLRAKDGDIVVIAYNHADKPVDYRVFAKDECTKDLGMAAQIYAHRRSIGREVGSPF